MALGSTASRIAHRPCRLGNPSLASPRNTDCTVGPTCPQALCCDSVVTLLWSPYEGHFRGLPLDLPHGQGLPGQTI